MLRNSRKVLGIMLSISGFAVLYLFNFTELKNLEYSFFISIGIFPFLVTGGLKLLRKN